MQDRISRRKRILNALFREEFGQKPTLLPELRWAVFRREMFGTKINSSVMSLSYKKSFARTLNHHQGQLHISQLRVSWQNSPQLIARWALYELDTWDEISGLLRSRKRRAKFSFFRTGGIMSGMHWEFQTGSGVVSYANLINHAILPIVIRGAIEKPILENFPVFKCQITHNKNGR
jgi:hypothetical protein